MAQANYVLASAIFRTLTAILLAGRMTTFAWQKSSKLLLNLK